jgi:rubrerythrin
VLTQKLRRRFERTDAIKRLWDEALPDANLEDQWERDVARLARQEAGASDDFDVDVGGQGQGQSSYAYTVQRHGIAALSATLTRERVDQVARADAIRRLIKEEAALAAKEKAQRDAERRVRWEAKMLELHGERWRDRFPNLKDGKVSAQRQLEW